MASRIQMSVPLRNAILGGTGYEAYYGTSPKFRLYTGDPPASVNDASTGTLIVEITCPSDWAAAPSLGAVAKNGTWSGTAVATGVVGYYRMYKSAGVDCEEQSRVTKAVSLTTTVATSAYGNTLTFTSTAGVVVGDGISAVGVPAGTVVQAVFPTYVVMSATSELGVASGATVNIGDTSGGMSIINSSITSGQTVTIDIKTLICPGE